ncbi:501_t:CDS:1, partial [Gigaspora margarita]
LKNIALTNENYEKYQYQHFTNIPLSLLIEKNVSFSNQQKYVHNTLRRIKDNENYGDNFFVAAQKFINN